MYHLKHEFTSVLYRLFATLTNEYKPELSIQKKFGRFEIWAMFVSVLLWVITDAQC